MERIKLGVVGVDSGQLLICDPCYLMDDSPSKVETAKSLHNCAVKEDGDADHSQIRNKTVTVNGNTYGGAEVGLKFDSGYGDGAYSVYGYKNKDGRIIKVEIIMGEHMINNKGEVITDYDETQDDIYLDKKSGRA